jgi:phosphoribosylformimino-5-aminoimidazole carboxamide ribotide isomerase
MELIPAIDLRGGRVVRLQQGDFARETVYDPDPAGVAERLLESGAPRLHVVDLDAARDGSSENGPVIRSILAAAGNTPVQVGGGLRTLGRIEDLLAEGADRVIVGTIALERPTLLRDAATLHPGRVVLGVDARGGQVAIRGWMDASARTPLDVVQEFEDLPLGAVLHTDIGRDGTLEGANVASTAELARATRHPVIASGGIGSMDDLLAVARVRVIAGAVVGQALYTGRVNLRDALAQLSRC